MALKFVAKVIPAFEEVVVVHLKILQRKLFPAGFDILFRGTQINHPIVKSQDIAYKGLIARTKETNKIINSSFLEPHYNLKRSRMSASP